MRKHTSRFRALLISAAVALLAAACATVFRGGVAPNGLARPEDGLRRQMVAGRYEAALGDVAPAKRAAPDDELLGALYLGLLAHYAGEYAESARQFELALFLTDERYTRSVTRGALSLISNDLALAYQPDRVERLLIHYYNALNYLHLGEPDGAAVEARRLSWLLQRYDDASDPGDLGTRALLRYFAGAVFEAAGDHADADVAYRNARRLAGDRPFAELTPQADGQGEVVVFIERGFVAHRVEQSIHVMLLPEEVESLTGSEQGEGRAATAALVAARVVAHALTAQSPGYDMRTQRTLVVPAPPPPPRPPANTCPPATAGSSSSTGRSGSAAADSAAAHADTAAVAGARAEGAGGRGGPPAAEGAGRGGDASQGTGARSAADCKPAAERRSNPYLLRIAWPTLYREWRPAAAQPVLLGAGPAPSQPLLRTDLSRAVIDEFEHERNMLLVRTILRGATKFAVTRTVERRAGDVDETLGQVAGLLSNLSGALLERADTRSWHLLPGELSVVRVSLDAGEHRLSVQLPGYPGASGSADRVIALGDVLVESGRVTVLSARLFQ